MEQEQIANEQAKVGSDYQRAILLDEWYEQLRMVHSANQNLDNKAATLFQVGGLVTGIVAALSALGVISTKSGWEIGLLVAVFVAFMAMIVLSALAWIPRRGTVTPGSPDWDRSYRTVLAVSDEAGFLQIISNLKIAITENTERGHEKGGLIRLSAGALIVQMLCLLLLAVVE